MTRSTNTIRTSYKRKTEIDRELLVLISCRRKYKNEVYCEKLDFKIKVQINKKK
jgi:hypothetical protein